MSGWIPLSHFRFKASGHFPSKLLHWCYLNSCLKLRRIKVFTYFTKSKKQKQRLEKSLRNETNLFSRIFVFLPDPSAELWPFSVFDYIIFTRFKCFPVYIKLNSLLCFIIFNQSDGLSFCTIRDVYLLYFNNEFTDMLDLHLDVNVAQLKASWEHLLVNLMALCSLYAGVAFAKCTPSTTNFEIIKGICEITLVFMCFLSKAPVCFTQLHTYIYYLLHPYIY